jgi:hypothetical protein
MAGLFVPDLQIRQLPIQIQLPYLACSVKEILYRNYYLSSLRTRLEEGDSNS